MSLFKWSVCTDFTLCVFVVLLLSSYMLKYPVPPVLVEQVWQPLLLLDALSLVLWVQDGPLSPPCVHGTLCTLLEKTHKHTPKTTPVILETAGLSAMKEHEVLLLYVHTTNEVFAKSLQM